MRIATVCTLAFAICGERLSAEEKKEEKISHPLWRWFAGSLLLGASVHGERRWNAGSGSGRRPAHTTYTHTGVGRSASRFGRPAGIREREPLKGWGRGRDKIDEVWRPAWEEWRSNAENYLKGGRSYKRLLGVMVEKGYKLLVKIDDETSVHGSEAEWKVLADDVKEFQEWQEDLRNRYHSTDHKLTTFGEGLLDYTLKVAMHDSFSKLLWAQREIKAAKILDVLDAAEHGDHFNVDGIPWEEYDIDPVRSGFSWMYSTAAEHDDHPPSPFRFLKLKKYLQNMKGKHLQNLWLSATLESAKRNAQKRRGRLLIKSSSGSSTEWWRS